jgi:hypothetical protein
MARLMTQAVSGKVEQLGIVLSELLALYSDPANADDFARHEAALSTTLTKHQLICTALRCADQSFTSRKENRRPKK